VEKDVFLPRAVFAAVPPPYSVFDRAKVVILPVPYETSTEWRSGTRDAPQTIIDASRYLEMYDLELDRETYRVGIHTLPEVEVLMSGAEGMIQRVYQIIRELVQKGKFVVMLGGEHSLTLAAVQAFKETFPQLSVLQFDAHADLRDEYLGTKYGQACVMRRVSELCPIVQVGIRSLCREEKQFLDVNGMTPFYMSTLAEDEDFVGHIASSLSEDVYVTIDADVFDPSIMPAVGTPEPGGLQWQQVLDIVKAIAHGKHVVGFDLVEFCPREGPMSCAFTLAKLVYRLIGYAVPYG
jgi:agmatinase